MQVIRFSSILVINILLILLSSHSALSQERKTGIEINIYPLHSNYSIQKLHKYQNDAPPWFYGFKAQMRLNYMFNDHQGIFIATGYSRTSLAAGFLTGEDQNLDAMLSGVLPSEINLFDLSVSYQYNIQLSKHLLLNPEVGLTITQPILTSQLQQDTGYYEGNIVITSKNNRVPSPVISVSGGVWLKQQFKNGNALKIGFIGSLPVRKTILSSYTLYSEQTENNIREDVEVGFEYWGVGIAYSILFKKRN